VCFVDADADDVRDVVGWAPDKTMVIALSGKTGERVAARKVAEGSGLLCGPTEHVLTFMDDKPSLWRPRSDEVHTAARAWYRVNYSFGTDCLAAWTQSVRTKRLVAWTLEAVETPSCDAPRTDGFASDYRWTSPFVELWTQPASVGGDQYELEPTTDPHRPDRYLVARRSPRGRGPGPDLDEPSQRTGKVRWRTVLPPELPELLLITTGPDLVTVSSAHGDDLVLATFDRATGKPLTTATASFADEPGRTKVQLLADNGEFIVVVRDGLVGGFDRTTAERAW
jgi:hypothetical protein